MTVVPMLPVLTLRGASIAPVILALKEMDSLAQVCVTAPQFQFIVSA